MSLGKLAHGQVQGLKITAYSLFGLLSLFRPSFHLLIVVCNTAYIKKEYFLWQYTNGMDWHYLFSFGSYPNMRYLFSTDYQTNGKYSMKKQYKSFQESSVKVIGSLFK